MRKSAAPKDLASHGLGRPDVRRIDHKRATLAPISGRVDKVSATKTKDLGSISCRVKPNAIKIGIHSFPA